MSDPSPPPQISREAIEELVKHVGCGDVDNMMGCAHCDRIRAMLEAAGRQYETADPMRSIMSVLRDVVSVNGSQKEAARVLCISPQYLCDILAGRREISAEVADSLGYQRVVVYLERKSSIQPSDVKRGE